MKSVQSKDVAQLNELLEALGKETEPRCKVLREHLESARFFLVGLMPDEYALSLKMADEALDCVSDHDLRARIMSFVRGT